jgi:predicted O-methyltransferase YrrM
MPSVHRPTFAQFVQNHGWKSGAELGVDKGILTRLLLEAVPDLALIAVDVFPDRERSRRAFELERQYPNLTLIEATTADASTLVPDGSLDFVFIDADHGYEAVADDINRWAPKVRSGGWVGGHDYSKKFPGVIKAADRAFGRRVETMAGSIWGAWV